MQKRALITGINGQDGSYLSEFLLAKGYAVHGMVRRASTLVTTAPGQYRMIQPIAPSVASDSVAVSTGGTIKLHYSDMSDALSVYRLIQNIQPHEIYNLAAQSHVGASFDVPKVTVDSDGLGVLRLLEAVKFAGLTNFTRLFNASSNELFGKATESGTDLYRNETTIFNPGSPYAVAKLFSYSLTKHYREAYSIFACNGILFNHESSRRSESFVTRKITRAAAAINAGLQDFIVLGNLNASRDWGHAKDFVEAMWMMLQHSSADDFVIATGQSHTVREFVEIAFKHVGIQLDWQGLDVNEIGVDKLSGKIRVKLDPQFYRPIDNEKLFADPGRAMTQLGWTPRYTFAELIQEMVDADMAALKKKQNAK